MRLTKPEAGKNQVRSMIEGMLESGVAALFAKEVLRTWKVGQQTLIAPVVTSMLYLFIFTHALGTGKELFNGVSYGSFLLAGLVMMSVMQNAFANTSSSLIQSKVTGNLLFVLVTPLRPWEIALACVGAAVVRGMAVAAGVFIAGQIVAPTPIAHPLSLFLYVLLGASMLGALGMVAGIVALRFEEVAAFQNFFISPLTMLSGVFYTLGALPPFWRRFILINPFYYLVSGAHESILGVSEVSGTMSFSIAFLSLGGVISLLLWMLAKGHKLRN